MNFQRLFWGTLGIILFILFGVGIYLGQKFIGIGPVPVRSAFAGRLPGTPEGNSRRFQFYYATNRSDHEDTFNGQGNEIGQAILTGTFDVLIAPTMKILPFIWFDETTMKWAARQEIHAEQFNSRLRASVQNSPKKSLLVMVWGFRDWFQSAALKTAYTAYALDINTPVLLFDWPGNQGEGARGYRASQEIANQSGPDLGRVLAKVINETGAENVWLMGSSLGCQTICEGLKWLSTQPDLLKNKPKLSHVVLSAPDVSAQAFDEKFGEVINSLSQHLTAYVSSNDRALLMSHWLNRGRRLGRTAEITLPPEDRTGQYEFEEALELLELQAKGAKDLAVVDATPINLLRNLHHFFTDSPEFFDDLYQRLQRPDEILNRRLHSVRTGPQGTAYWILWND